MTPTDLATARRVYLQARRNGSTYRRAVELATEATNRETAEQAAWEIDPTESAEHETPNEEAKNK